MTGHVDLKQTTCSQGRLDHQSVYTALEQSQFVPFYQPIITLQSGHLAGYEVLARWQHPLHGILPPSRFIELAERDGWIGELSLQILEKAFAAASALPEHLTLAINVSAVQLRDSELPGKINAIAQRSGFSLARLILEITESAMIDNLESAGIVIHELKAMGCRLALDDFGTGYSSLHHLQSLPFDELKVDRSFVSSMIEKRESRKIVSAVVGLGQSLGLATVAEGIETQEQAEMMLWLGCEFGQGYFYGRPCPVEELTASVMMERERMAVPTSPKWGAPLRNNLRVSPSDRLAHLQAVYDGAPVGLAFVDCRMRYMNLNKRMSDLNGSSIEEHLGRNAADVMPEIFSQVQPYLQRALNGEAIADIEVRIPRMGTTHLRSYQPAFDEDGEVVGVSLAVVDITDRKRTEEALKQSEHHYRNIVELNPQVLWVMDPQGRNLDVSPRWDKKTGLMNARSATYDWLKLVHPDDIQSTVRSIAESRKNGAPIRVEYRVTDDNNNWQWRRSVGSPRFGPDGGIICWYGSIQEIDPPTSSRDGWSLVGEGTSEASAQKGGRKNISGSDIDEARRQALLDLEILDTPAEPEFDDLVALAAQFCTTPMSMVSLLDVERQWFKASVGTSSSENPISTSFCGHAVRGEGVFVVEDATKDERFEDNPLVTGEPHIRFYAGVPLYANGVGIGTLCVIDTVPRSLSPVQMKALNILSQQVQARLDLRAERKQLQRALAENRRLTNQMEDPRKAALCA